METKAVKVETLSERLAKEPTAKVDSITMTGDVKEVIARLVLANKKLKQVWSTEYGKSNYSVSFPVAQAEYQVDMALHLLEELGVIL